MKPDRLSVERQFYTDGVSQKIVRVVCDMLKRAEDGFIDRDFHGLCMDILYECVSACNCGSHIDYAELEALVRRAHRVWAAGRLDRLMDRLNGIVHESEKGANDGDSDNQNDTDDDDSDTDGSIENSSVGSSVDLDDYDDEL